MNAVHAEYDPEHAVIEAIQQGDQHAMAELIRRQGPWLRGVLFGVLGRRGEVDDVAQRVWMRVWREARRLDDPRRWRAWLYRIARNAATDAGRSRKRRRLLLDAVFRQQREPGTEHRGPEQRLAAQERHQAMLDAIASLPPLYREPFVLKHLEDWSYQQIGEAMGLPVDTVETRLVRARRLLRERLGAEPPAGARGSVRTRRGSGGHPLRSDR